MANRGSSERFAVVDLDETLIEGSLGSRIARTLIDPRKNRGLVPRVYYLKLLRYIHVPLLAKLKRSYRIYRYVLHKTYRLYLELLSDPRVDRDALLGLMKSVASEVPIPPESKEFVKKLKERGYKVVLLTASPQEIAEVAGKKLGVDVVIGSRHGFVLDREGKERVVRELMRRGSVDIIVGNPGNEPFWLARRLAIQVRSPRDLKKWVVRL